MKETLTHRPIRKRTDYTRQQLYVTGSSRHLLVFDEEKKTWGSIKDFQRGGFDIIASIGSELPPSNKSYSKRAQDAIANSECSKRKNGFKGIATRAHRFEIKISILAKRKHSVFFR